MPPRVSSSSFGFFISILMKYCKIMVVCVKIIAIVSELLPWQRGGMENKGNAASWVELIFILRLSRAIALLACLLACTYVLARTYCGRLAIKAMVNIMKTKLTLLRRRIRQIQRTSRIYDMRSMWRDRDCVIIFLLSETLRNDAKDIYECCTHRHMLSSRMFIVA